MEQREKASFRHGDVATLRRREPISIQVDNQEWTGVIILNATPEWIDDLADRIAALLPPRKG